MAGQLGQEVEAITNGFNQSQQEYKIKPIYKGNYLESLTSFAAAFRAHQPPALIQVFEVGTKTMLQPKGVIKPVDELMKEQGLSLPKDGFFKPVLHYYSENGQLMAMPFNISIPVMYFNADALGSLGVTSRNFPHTWRGLETLAKKLQDAGFHCVYTSAYPGWIFIESFAALHRIPLSNRDTTALTYNNKDVLSHLSRLKRWQQQHYFEYGGRFDDATVLFSSGRCPLFSQSSGAYMGLSQLVSFQVGMALIPYDDEINAKRSNNVIGGAALWATALQTKATYRGIAKFFEYFASPAVQLQWHQNTGYLPLGIDGVYQSLLKKSRYPSLVLAKMDLKEEDRINNTSRLGVQNQIRTMNDEAIEAIFAGIYSPKASLDEAVARANHALSRFERNTKN